jgi:hypothetical protein
MYFLTLGNVTAIVEYVADPIHQDIKEYTYSTCVGNCVQIPAGAGLVNSLVLPTLFSAICQQPPSRIYAVPSQSPEVVC